MIGGIFMKSVLIAGHWMNIPEKEKESEALYIATDDLLLIQEALQRFKDSESNDSVGLMQRKNIINIERLLSFLNGKIINRLSK